MQLPLPPVLVQIAAAYEHMQHMLQHILLRGPEPAQIVLPVALRDHSILRELTPACNT